MTVSCAPQPARSDLPPARAHQHMPRRIVFAQLRQRRNRERHQPQRFARRIEAPARERQQPVVREMRKIIAKRIGRVEIVFGKRESAGGGGSPGIHQRRLNHLILLRAAAHETAAVFDVDMHVRPQIETRG